MQRYKFCSMSCVTTIYHRHITTVMYRGVQTDDNEKVPCCKLRDRERTMNFCIPAIYFFVDYSSVKDN